MLTTAQTLALTTLAKDLAGPKPPSPKDILAVLTTILSDDAAARNATASTLRARRGGSAGGRPSVAYAVELDPRWRTTCAGMAQTHELIAETLTELGRKAQIPSKGSLAVSLSRNGTWQRTLDTDDGMLVLTVTRQIPTEAPTSDDQ